MELTGFYTQRSLELQAELQAAGKPAVVSRVCAGSGATTAAALTLSEERMALTVGTPHRKGAVTALPVTLAEVKAETDFLLTEIGVYVRDTAGGEVLCRVYRLGQNIPVTAGGRTVIRLELEEAFGEAEALRAEGTPGGLLTEGDLDALRGVPGGLATLDGAGDVPVGQIPTLDYAASVHAEDHASDGGDALTPASIGAYSKDEIDAFLANKRNWKGGIVTGVSILYWAGKQKIPSECSCNTNTSDMPYSGYWMVTLNIYSDAGWKKLTATNILSGDTWIRNCNVSTWGEWKKLLDETATPDSIGAAPAYTYGTADLTAGTSALETGKLYFVYE